MTSPRTWLITGAGRGLGRALALAVREAEAVEALVADVVHLHGRIDVLVTNVGYGLIGTIEEADEDQAHDIVETDLLAPLRLSRAVLPAMRARGSGHILQISSTGGSRCSAPPPCPGRRQRAPPAAASPPPRRRPRFSPTSTSPRARCVCWSGTTPRGGWPRCWSSAGPTAPATRDSMRVPLPSGADSPADPGHNGPMTTLADFTATAIDGSDTDLGRYVGQVVLIVNTASKCGFTPQYDGLQELQSRYREEGLIVLGFPCDQFNHQEPGTDAEIAEFCSTSFGVDFPMFSKVEVNGEGAHPLYQWLTGAHEGVGGPIEAAPIGWNFTKFLLGRDGTVRARYASEVEPATLAEPVEEALGARG